MRKIWFNPNIGGNGVLWIVGAALQIGGWVNQKIAISLLVIAFIWSIATLVYWLKFRYKKTDKPKLKVEKSVFVPFKWVLKITNESEDAAGNCIGILEMVEEAKPPVNPTVWNDMFAHHRLMWEDNNSIPGRGSAMLRVININYHY